MKRSVKSLIGFTLGATDGEIGKVKEFYFDDDSWTVRYLVVETGNWLSGKKVLISPEAVMQPDWERETFPVNLTMDQVRNSPDIDTEKPVTRVEEERLYGYYPWNNYWAGSLWAGGIGTAGMMLPVAEPFDESIKAQKVERENVTGNNENKHLRSTAKVTGYDIKALDGNVGEVEDFIIDDYSWKLDFLVVDTGNWFPGKKVLVSPDWIREIVWETNRVTVDASVEQIKGSPEYDADQPVDDLYKKQLHDHYGRENPDGLI